MSKDDPLVQLETSGIHERDISAIKLSLEKLSSAGATTEQISIVVHNLVGNESFRQQFLKDYQSAVKSLNLRI